MIRRAGTVSLVVGKRTEDATHALVSDFHRRTGGRVMRLMTSDEYPAYATAIRDTYGHVVTPPRTGRPSDRGRRPPEKPGHFSRGRRVLGAVKRFKPNGV